MLKESTSLSILHMGVFGLEFICTFGSAFCVCARKHIEMQVGNSSEVSITGKQEISEILEVKSSEINNNKICDSWNLASSHAEQRCAAIELGCEGLSRWFVLDSEMNPHTRGNAASCENVVIHNVSHTKKISPVCDPISHLTSNHLDKRHHLLTISTLSR